MLRAEVAAFARARDWEQFHTPKNLAMAIAGEVGELVAEFQWLTDAQARDLDADARERVALEAADVLIYLVRLADVLDIDLLDAASRKIRLNEERYPPERSAGSAEKYTRLDGES